MEQFGKFVNRCRGAGCRLDVVRQTACLVVSPFIVDAYASLFDYMMGVQASDRKAFAGGLGLGGVSLAWPAVVQLWVFSLAYSRISHECSSLFIIVINLIFVFSLCCINWVRGLCVEPNFYVFLY